MPTIISKGLLISIAAGKHQFGGVRGIPIPDNIPNQKDEIRIRLERCTSSTPLTWPNPETIIDITVSVSYDGGTTFQPAGGLVGVPGGVVLARDGSEQIHTVWTLPISSGQSRRLKVEYEVVNGPVVTEQIIEAE